MKLKKILFHVPLKKQDVILPLLIPPKQIPRQEQILDGNDLLEYFTINFHIMDTFDIPILKKTYNLYKELHLLRIHIAKRDRYAIWERLENSALELLEHILLASQRQRGEKYGALEIASAKLNVLRILIRLTKDVKVIDNKKYLSLELAIDEIGRMLGGWLKSTNSPSQ